jgi:hypothetical protein
MLLHLISNRLAPAWVSDAPQDLLSPSVVKVGRWAPPRAFAVAGVHWHTKDKFLCLMVLILHHREDIAIAASIALRTFVASVLGAPIGGAPETCTAADLAR